MKALLMGLILAANIVNAKTVDLKGKKIDWAGSKVVGDGHKGHVTITEGKLNLNDKSVVESGTVAVDLKTIDSTDLKGEWKGKLEGHLKSADFFDVEKFPKATLNIKKVTKLKDHQVKIMGDLTIKNITKPIEFTAVQTPTTFSGKFNIDRTKWDVKYGSSNFFELAKDKIIENDIKLAFNFNLK